MKATILISDLLREFQESLNSPSRNEYLCLFISAKMKKQGQQINEKHCGVALREMFSKYFKLEKDSKVWSTITGWFITHECDENGNDTKHLTTKNGEVIYIVGHGCHYDECWVRVRMMEYVLQHNPNEYIELETTKVVTGGILRDHDYGDSDFLGDFYGDD